MSSYFEIDFKCKFHYQYFNYTIKFDQSIKMIGPSSNFVGNDIIG